MSETDETPTDGVNRPEAGDTFQMDEIADSLEYWGGDGEEWVLIDPDGEWEATVTYASVEIVEVTDLD